MSDFPNPDERTRVRIYGKAEQDEQKNKGILPEYSYFKNKLGLTSGVVWAGFYNKHHFVRVTGTYAGLHATPYPGRARLSDERAEVAVADLLTLFTSEPWAALPEIDHQGTRNALITLVQDDDIADCLFGLVQLIRPVEQTTREQLTDALHALQEMSAVNPTLLLPDQLADLTAHVEQLPTLAIPPTSDVAAMLVSLDTIRQALAFYHWRPTEQLRIFEEQAAQAFQATMANLTMEDQHWFAALIGLLAVQPNLEDELSKRIRGYLWNEVVHDNWHYLLFGQNAAQVVPADWLEASRDFIDRVRCNFGCLLTEAAEYQRVTIVGAVDAPVPVTAAEEDFLANYLPKSRTLTVTYYDPEPRTEELPLEIERLNVRTADELRDLLASRISGDKVKPFDGGLVAPLPRSATFQVKSVEFRSSVGDEHTEYALTDPQDEPHLPVSIEISALRINFNRALDPLTLSTVTPATPDPSVASVLLELLDADRASNSVLNGILAVGPNHLRQCTLRLAGGFQPGTYRVTIRGIFSSTFTGVTDQFGNRLNTDRSTNPEFSFIFTISSS